MFDWIVKILLWIVLYCAAYVPLVHALHMFQQNRYETGRYVTWMKDNFSYLLKKNCLVLCLNIVLTVVFFFVPAWVTAAVLFVYAVVLFRKEKKETYIKPLAWTARVKRQTVVMVVLYAVCTYLVLHVCNIPACAVALSQYAVWALIFPMAWITSPIEASVRKGFLNDAKKILESNSRLIKIGITGSFGKTTTKNIMQAVISEQYYSLMTPASFNTPMGITRTIREMLKPVHEVFVCEMGADHVGDIKELMDFVHPQIGVVTSIGPQHLNTFGSQANITREKFEMIECLPKEGFGVLNYDNPFIASYKVKNPVEIKTYGVHNHDVDYYADEITYTQTGSSFIIVGEGERIPFETKLLGELNILNILSAVAVARHLNVEWSVIQRAVKQMKQVEHRLELKKINGFRFIDDAFNANPTGSAMAVEVLGMMPGKRVIVTPGMIDLGEKQEEVNHHFGTLMKGKTDLVILVGKNQTKPIYEGLMETGYEKDHVLIFDTVKEAFAYIWQNLSTEDTILLENDLPDAFNH